MAVFGASDNLMVRAMRLIINPSSDTTRCGCSQGSEATRCGLEGKVAGASWALLAIDGCSLLPSRWW
uniref:Uncharacterized protein n=1 Tax=Oryza meridionalis TaxID=40149 RepID=A0A0E0EH90_9ORYZ